MTPVCYKWLHSFIHLFVCLFVVSCQDCFCIMLLLLLCTFVVFVSLFGSTMMMLLPPPNTLCLFVTLAYIFFSFWVFFDQDDAASPQASPPLLPSLHLLSSAGRGLPLSRQQVAKSALHWTSTVHNNTNSALWCTVFG